MPQACLLPVRARLPFMLRMALPISNSNLGLCRKFHCWMYCKSKHASNKQASAASDSRDLSYDRASRHLPPLPATSCCRRCWPSVAHSSRCPARQCCLWHAVLHRRKAGTAKDPIRTRGSLRRQHWRPPALPLLEPYSPLCDAPKCHANADAPPLTCSTGGPGSQSTAAGRQPPARSRYSEVVGSAAH